MNISEAKIRDKLINKLHILDSSLTYLEKESYLPSKLGTRGFIDILAKDDKGHLVAIELKKSDSTAREALHEVLKYLEGIKEQKRLKDDEIRIIILSTNWKELIVPFSSFCKRCECYIEGYILSLDDKFEPIAAEKVKPLSLNNDRLLCDHHAVRYYTSDINLEKGIKSHIECFKTKGISDYILVILSAPEGFRDRELNAIESNLKVIHENEGIGSDTDDDFIKNIREKFPDYKYMIYSATQLLNEEEYITIIQDDKDILEEVNILMDDYSGQDKLYFLHDNAVDNVNPTPFEEYIEIGYPAKFKQYVEVVGWNIMEIIRSGGFKENEFLSDETIVEELRGSAGTSRQFYRKKFDSENKAVFKQIKTEIKNCLFDNIQWQRQILHVVEQIEELTDKEVFTGEIHIYNPMHTILSIYQIVTSEKPFEWIPNYYIILERENGSSIYFGCLKRNNMKPSLDNALKEFYNNNPNMLFFTLSWGGYEANDNKIANSLGLKYSTFLCQHSENGSQYYEYSEYDFIKCEQYDPCREFLDFLQEEEKLVLDIIYLFEERSKQLGYTFI